MTTKQQFIAQARSQSPKPQYKTVNDEQIELTDDEYEMSLVAWAEMRLEQDAVEIEIANKVQARQSVLDKLGLTQDEAAALLG
jgi:predicted DNA-binding protein (UPF0251 family)